MCVKSQTSKYIGIVYTSKLNGFNEFWAGINWYKKLNHMNDEMNLIFFVFKQSIFDCILYKIKTSEIILCSIHLKKGN